VWVHEVPIQRASPPKPWEKLPSHIWAASLASAKEAARVETIRGTDLISGPIWDLETVALSGMVKAPVCLSLHTTYAMALEHKPEWRANSQQYKRDIEPVIAAEQRLLSSAPIILANSKTILDTIAEIYDIKFDYKNITIIHHGVEDLSMAPFIPPALNDKKQYTVFFGRHEARKGADLILRALPELLRQNADLEVVMIGANNIPLKDNSDTFADALSNSSLTKEMRTRVHMLGPLPRPELIGWLRAAAIVLLPSRFESFGLVYVECASLSKAIIALDIGASKEVIGQEAAHLIADDVHALVAAVGELISNPAKVTELQLNARARYAQNFTVQIMANAFEAFSNEIRTLEFKQVAK
jgi:glycogen(starch) synthase